MLKLWYKELLYLGSNNPISIVLYVCILSIFYNVQTFLYPPSESLGGVYRFDATGEDLIRFIGVGICLTEDVINYETSDVERLENALAAEFADLKFYRNMDDLHKALENYEVEVVAYFKIFETHNYRYELIMKNGIFNSNIEPQHYSWHKVHDAQLVVNKFLEHIITKAAPTKITYNYYEPYGKDEIKLKFQSDITFTWIIIIPFLFHLIDSWVNEHTSNMFVTLRSEGVKTLKFMVAKCSFYYLMFVLVSTFVWFPNMIMGYASLEKIILMLLLIGIYLAGAVFLTTLFYDSTFYPKTFLIISSLISECTQKNPIFKTPSVRGLIRSLPSAEGEWNLEEILVICICFWGLMGLSVYFEVLFTSDVRLVWYYPISRAFWWKKERESKPDPNYKEQNVKIPAKPKDGSKMELINKTLPAKPPKPFIFLDGVCKRINKIWKVNSVTINIRFDQLTVLYGHIGCGAEELLKIIKGEMKPDFGSIAYEDSQRKPSIVATCEVPIVNYLTVRSYLKYLGKLRKYKVENAEIDEILSELKLLEYAQNTLDMLTSTQKERLRVCAAFIGNPDVVLINRPTTDSFPENKCRISKFIEKRKPNRTIVLVTFDADEAESISDRVVLLSEGYVVLNGPVEVFRQRINSTFEFRVWPLSVFTDKERLAIINHVGAGDKKLADSMRFVETPNGKIRIFLPIEFRKSIPWIFDGLCSQVDELQISFIEMSRPTIQDVYENACYDPKQYAPLQNYDTLAESYTRQNLKYQTGYFFRLILKLTRDFTTKFVFCILVALLLGAMTYLLVHHLIGIGKKGNIGIRYEDRGIDKYKKFIAHIRSDKTVDAYLKPKFKLYVQNKVLLHLLKTTASSPIEDLSIKVDVNLDVREKTAVNSLFGRMAVFQIEHIFIESGYLLPILAIVQVFVYSITALISSSLMRVNLRPTKMLFPWPKYGYFLRLTAVNLSIFAVINLVTIITVTAMGLIFFTSAMMLSLMWFLVYISILPLIYFLVFYLEFIKSAVLIALAFSAFAVAIPSLISVYIYDENVLDYDTTINIIAFICWFSPPSTLQVIAAFLTSDFIENQELVLMCFVALSYFWMPICFVILANSAKLGLFYQMFITAKIWITAPFYRQSAVRAPYHIKDSFIFATTTNYSKDAIIKTPSCEKVESALPSSSGPASRADAGIDSTSPMPSDPSPSPSPISQNFVDNGTSFITKREEDVIGYVSRTSIWYDQQAVEINNNFTLVIGDQWALKSQLLSTIADCNDQDFRIAYIPQNDILPSILTPIELMEVVAAGRGIVMDRAQMAFLLDTFSMFYIANIQIQNLTDAERRTLALVTMIMQKPSMIILDQTDMFLPSAKMTTVWSICTRLKENGVAVIFTTSNVQSAEHTATNYAHVYKCQFVSVQASPVIKSKLSRIIVEIDLVPGEDATKTLHELQETFRGSQYISTRCESRRSLLVPNDDFETITQLIRELEKNWRKFLRYSLRSTNFEEYVANSLIKT